MHNLLRLLVEQQLHRIGSLLCYHMGVIAYSILEYIGGPLEYSLHRLWHIHSQKNVCPVYPQSLWKCSIIVQLQRVKIDIPALFIVIS